MLNGLYWFLQITPEQFEQLMGVPMKKLINFEEELRVGHYQALFLIFIGKQR